MTPEEIVSAVDEAINSYLTGDNERKLDRDTRFHDDLGADSLDMIELTMVFEDRFGIALEDEEVEKVDTVGKARDLIISKLGE